jgi:serine/threonine protein kinase
VTPDESETLLREEEFSLWLAACDEQLAAGAPVASVDEVGAPDALRSRLEREVAWCQWVRRNWPRGAAALGEPPASTLGAGPPTSPPSPEGFGRFLVRQELGRGAFGVVYRAYDPRLRRELALKVPRAEVVMTAELRTRFRHEAMAAAGLDHPNIVPVYEAGEEGPVCFIASAYCPGTTLAAWLRRRTGPVPYRVAAGWVATLAEAVEHAHRRGVLHRDLKPSNVLLEEPAPGTPDVEGDRDGSELVPRVTDFGLAKLLDPGPEATAAAHPTLSGVILGTPSYMAPEQAEGRAGAAGPAADIYSLGVILYELLTGRPPFQADSTLETLVLVRTQDPLPPSRLRPRVPRDLETICLKCLEKDPRRRFASAGELADDLHHFLRGEPIRARPTPTWERAIKWMKRRPAVAALIAVSSLAALVLVAVILAANARLQQQRDYADAKRQEAEAQSREAQAQRGQALANLRLAMQAVDQMLTRVGSERLANVPQAETVRRDLLQDALKFYEGFARQRSDDPELALELAQAHARLAAISRMLGDKSKEEQGYRRAIAVLENPDVPFPDVLAHDRELARNYSILGQEFLNTRGRQAAEAALRQALALQERLVEEFPDDLLSRSDLAKTHDRFGILFGETQRPTESERAFRTAIKLHEELVRRCPDELDYRRGLALYRSNLAVLYGNLNRFGEAEKLFRLNLDLWEGLAAHHPEILDYRSKLALTYRHLYQICTDTGRPAEAEQALRRAAELRRKLVEDFPSTPHFRAELGAALHLLAECALRRGDLTEAHRLVDEAIGQTRKVLDVSPENPIWLGHLRAEHATRAAVFLRLGDPDQAAQAVTALTKLPSADAQDWVRAGSLLAGCAVRVERDTALASDQRRRQARAYADQAIESLRQAIRKGYRDRAFLETELELG